MSILSSVILNLATPESFTFGRTIALAPFNGKERLEENLYRDKVTDGRFSKFMHIESYVTDKNYLELFVVHTTRWEEEYIKPACNFHEEIEKEGVDYDAIRLACLEKFYDVKLNGEILKDNFIYQRNSKTGQDGLLSVVDISELESGKHAINLIYNFHDLEQDTIYRNSMKKLMFYKN